MRPHLPPAQVLSVVAQQVLTIIRAKAIRAKTFTFEGVEIRLVMTCDFQAASTLSGCEIDVAVMAPDYDAMIVEITLHRSSRHMFPHLQALL